MNIIPKTKWHYRLWRWSQSTRGDLPNMTDRCSYIRQILLGVLWKLIVLVASICSSIKTRTTRILNNPWIKFPGLMLTSPLWIPFVLIALISLLVLNLYFAVILVTCGIGYPTFGEKLEEHPITFFPPLKVHGKSIRIWMLLAPIAVPTHVWLLIYHGPQDLLVLLKAFGIVMGTVFGFGLLLFLWVVSEPLRWKLRDLIPDAGPNVCPIITFSDNNPQT